MEGVGRVFGAKLEDRPMGAAGFFELEEWLAKLDGLGDRLVKVRDVVDGEGFRAALDRALSKARKSNAGRKK